MPSTPSALRRWLRRTPHPTKLRVDGRDVAVEGKGPNMWALTEQTVLALKPSRVEALDENGLMLRATVLDSDEPEEGDEPKPKDDTKSDIILLARLIKEAGDDGAKRHAEAYSLAFMKMVDLVQILATRLGGLETAWQKAMNQTAKAQADAVLASAQAQGGDDDEMSTAIKSMLAAAAMKQIGLGAAAPAAAAVVANGAPNGVKKAKG